MASQRSTCHQEGEGHYLAVSLPVPTFFIPKHKLGEIFDKNSLYSRQAFPEVRDPSSEFSILSSQGDYGDVSCPQTKGISVDLV